MRPTTATIRRDSPRYEDWRRVFGAGVVPIESPFAHWAEAPGVGRARFYRLSVRSLAADTRARLVAHLAGRFGLPAAEVERGLDDPEVGCPILADDVTVAIDARAFL